MGNSHKMRVAVAAVLVAAASARNFGPVNIDGVGQKYLLAPDWSAGNIQMNGDSGFTLNGGGRVYLGNSPNDGWDPNNYYCDANFVGGQWCPEYDTLESNKHTIAGTLHTCNGGPGYWSDCDRGGCQNNAFYVDSNMFCPEDRCTINT